MYMQAMDQRGVVESVRTNLKAYNKAHPIKIFNGLFIDATAVQIDTCRLAALMIEPSMAQFLALKSDPPQDRNALDTPALRAQALTQECLQELQRLHNDVDFVPHHNADVSVYVPDMFITTAHPAEHRDYAWIATTFQTIKTTMGTLLSNFNGSGNGGNDSNDSVRDIEFWNKFCKRQPLWMYIYLLWDHGRDAALAWNSILLPPDQSMDIGGTDNAAAPTTPQNPQQAGNTKSGSKHKKRLRDDDNFDEASKTLVQVSTSLLQALTPPPPSTASTLVQEASPVPEEVRNAERAEALSKHADLLKQQFDKCPPELPGVKQKLRTSLEQVLTRLCDLTSQQD